MKNPKLSHTNPYKLPQVTKTTCRFYCPSNNVGNIAHLISKLLVFMLLQSLLKLTEADLQSPTVCYILAFAELPFQLLNLERYMLLVQEAESPALWVYIGNRCIPR
jgi:hypothetical protein